MRDYFAFLRSQWALLLFGFLCVFWGNLGQSFFLGWYGEAIKSDLNISAQQYGSLYSLATLASALTILWVGGLIDRWSLMGFVYFISVGLVIACLCLFFAHNAYWLFIGFLLIRLFGQGLFPHAGLTSMARYFDQSRGKAISVASMGVSFGEVLLPLLAVYMMLVMSWQSSWLWLALSVPLILLPALKFCLSQPSAKAEVERKAFELKSGPQIKNGRAILLKDYRFWLAAPTILSMPFMLTGIFIHQDFILREKNWSPEWMATCFVFYGVAHWLSSLMFGILVDRFSGLRLLKFYNIPLILGVLLLANFEGQWVAVSLMVMLGIAIGGSGTVTGSLWAEVYGTRALGGIRATSSAIIVLSTSLSPIMFGWFIDHHYSFSNLFNVAAVTLVFAWLGLFFSYRRGSNMSQAY